MMLLMMGERDAYGSCGASVWGNFQCLHEHANAVGRPAKRL
jgi:hypothetical protein